MTFELFTFYNFYAHTPGIIRHLSNTNKQYSQKRKLTFTNKYRLCDRMLRPSVCLFSTWVGKAFTITIHIVLFKAKISCIYKLLLFYSQGIYHTQALKSKGISCEYYCAWWRAHCPPKNNISGVVWWCQLWKRFLPAPRAPDTIFSTNADTVDNRGKGPGLSTLSSKCTHCYFLSTLLLYFQLWNIGQCVSFRVQVSDPFLTMTRRWGMMCPGTLDDGQQCA